MTLILAYGETHYEKVRRFEIKMMNESEGRIVIDFERAFSETEQAAASTVQSAEDLKKQAKRLQKAAKDGKINEIKKGRQRLETALGSLRQEVANAVQAWPFKDEEEEEYLEKHYASELCNVAKEKGLTIHERDGKLIAHPSIVEVLPRDRAVRIDRKKVPTLRPSRMVEDLVKSQKKPPRFKSDDFLETLHWVYTLISREELSARLINDGYGPVVPLVEVYKALTPLPGSKRDYDRVDFTRDIYSLDASGPSRTKKGSRVSFPSSTGAKRARDTFQFVGPDDQLMPYYGIQFSRGE